MSASEPHSEFAFVTCQPGAELALKRELARVAPRLAPAYQRPGLVTFRSPDSLSPALRLDSVFARQYGISLGLCSDPDTLATRTRALPRPLCLQVVARDAGEDAADERALELERTLRRELDDSITESEVAREGELVASVVVGARDAPLLGCHRHHGDRSPYPGASLPLALPDAAPSRAYLKIEEAIQTFRLPVRAGDTALEIGAAPGGAAYALRQRGIHVFAVDPGAMDRALLDKAGPSGARVVHLPVAMRDLRRDQLPARIDWLLLDVHLAPQIALRAARRVASELRSTLCGAVLTLKLNDWSLADRIDGFLAQAREMGLVDAKAKQFVAHRQEIAIVGLTSRGLARV